MLRILTAPPQLLRLRYEPGEIRPETLDLSAVLTAPIATVQVDDPAGIVADLAADNQRIDLRLAAIAGNVTLTAASAHETERITLRVEVVDPAGSIQEVDP